MAILELHQAKPLFGIPNMRPVAMPCSASSRYKRSTLLHHCAFNPQWQIAKAKVKQLLIFEILPPKSKADAHGTF
jgi:hypothetical protein